MTTVVVHVAQVATAVGVLLAVLGLGAQLRTRKHSLGQAYLARYWHLFDLRREQVAEDEMRRRDDLYLEFCEDQFDMARLGWIDPGTWIVWHAGIRGAVAAPDVSSYTGRGGLEHLRACIGTSGLGRVHAAWRCPGLGRVSWRWRALWWLDRRIFGTPHP